MNKKFDPKSLSTEQLNQVILYVFGESAESIQIQADDNANLLYELLGLFDVAAALLSQGNNSWADNIIRVGQRLTSYTADQADAYQECLGKSMDNALSELPATVTGDQTPPKKGKRANVYGAIPEHTSPTPNARDWINKPRATADGAVIDESMNESPATATGDQTPPKKGKRANADGAIPEHTSPTPNARDWINKPRANADGAVTIDSL